MTATDIGRTVRVQLDLEYEMSGTDYRMTRAYGSFERLDSSFSMTGKYILLANYHHSEGKYIKEYTNPPDTFSYRPFTNWVDTTYKPVAIAGYAKCITSRGDYRYEVRCDAIVIGDKLL